MSLEDLVRGIHGLEECISRIQKIEKNTYEFEKKIEYLIQSDNMTQALHYARKCELAAGTENWNNIVEMEIESAVFTQRLRVLKVSHKKTISNIRKCNGDVNLINALITASEHLSPNDIGTLSEFAADNLDHLEDIAEAIRFNGKKRHTAFKLYEYFDKNGIKGVDFLQYFPIWGRNIDEKVMLFDILEKYLDNKYEDVLGILNNHMRFYKTNLNEMLTDRAYEAIKIDHTIIPKILVGNYERYASEILDEEFGKKANYADLDLLIETYKLIEGIHEKRNPGKFEKIEVGFYDEMNRAISQGYDFQSKRKMFRQYCTDVQRAMKDNVEELMYIA